MAIDPLEGYDETGQGEGVKVYASVQACELIKDGGGIMQARGVMKHITDKGSYHVDITFPYIMEAPYSSWGTDEDTCDMLTGLVKALKPQCILEAGTNKGRGTVALADGIDANGQGRVITVDIADREVKDIIGRPCIEFVFADTTNDLASHLPCKKGEIDMAFLDASHSYSGIQAELKFVKEFCAPHCIAFIDNINDTTWPGIMPAVKDFCCEHGWRYVVLPTLHGMGVVQR